MITKANNTEHFTERIEFIIDCYSENFLQKDVHTHHYSRTYSASFRYNINKHCNDTYECTKHQECKKLIKRHVESAMDFIEEKIINKKNYDENSIFGKKTYKDKITEHQTIIFTRFIHEILSEAENSLIKKFDLKFTSITEAQESIKILQKEFLFLKPYPSMSELQKTYPKLEYPLGTKYVVPKLVAQAEAWIKIKELGLDYSFEDMYKFIVDGKKQYLGQYIFDNEAGYSFGCFRGINFSLDHKEKLNAYWFLALIKNCCEYTNKDASDQYFDLGPITKKHICGWGFAQRDHDPNGFEDLEKRASIKGPFSYEKKLTYNNKLETIPGYIFRAHPRSEKERIKELNSLFIGLNNFLQDKKRNAAFRLLAILWTAREVVTRHFFHDGNGRSCHMIPNAYISRDKDLKKFLMLPFEPNMFAGNGPEKILYRAIEAMNNFIKKGNGSYAPTSNQNLRLDSLKEIDPSLNELHKQAIELIRTHGSKWESYTYLWQYGYTDYAKDHITTIVIIISCLALILSFIFRG